MWGYARSAHLQVLVVRACAQAAGADGAHGRGRRGARVGRAAGGGAGGVDTVPSRALEPAVRAQHPRQPRGGARAGAGCIRAWSRGARAAGPQREQQGGRGCAGRGRGARRDRGVEARREAVQVLRTGTSQSCGTIICASQARARRSGVCLLRAQAGAKGLALAMQAAHGMRLSRSRITYHQKRAAVRLGVRYVCWQIH
jgi:hypothetical protein